MSPCLKPNLIWFVLSTNFSSYYQLHTEVIMKAAVVSSFGAAPRYEEFPSPTAAGDDGTVVDVIAAGLHPRVRSQANGSHYTSTGELPLVPGIDGVGRGADGLLRYFILPDTTMGAMAEQTVIDPRRSIVLPEDSDPIAVAAAMNPAMSSWVALHQRVPFQAGQNVLVLGATGNAGRMAVQIARLLGADQVITAGQSRDRLAGLGALGATATVLLEADAGAVAHPLRQAAATAPSRSPVSKSALSPGPRRRSLQPRSAPPASRSSAAGKGPSAPGKSSPNCPHSRGRSPTGSWTSTRAPCH